MLQAQRAEIETAKSLTSETRQKEIKEQNEAIKGKIAEMRAGIVNKMAVDGAVFKKAIDKIQEELATLFVKGGKNNEVAVNKLLSRLMYGVRQETVGEDGSLLSQDSKALIMSPGCKLKSRKNKTKKNQKKNGRPDCQRCRNWLSRNSRTVAPIC